MGEVQHALGVMRFEQGKYAEATAYLLRAIEIEPTNALYHRNIGPAIQLSSGKSDEAIRYMCRSIELNPLDGEAHFNLLDCTRRLASTRRQRRRIARRSA